MVLAHIALHKLHYIVSDGGVEDSGGLDSPLLLLTISAVDLYKWAYHHSSLFVGLEGKCNTGGTRMQRRRIGMVAYHAGGD